MSPMESSLSSPECRLPVGGVPEIEFSGIAAQYAALKNEIEQRVGSVFMHGRYIKGPEVTELENRLAEISGAAHCVAVGNGTDALIAALMAYGVGPGDAVFVPAFTFTASAEVILLLGATPVFVDVQEHSFNIDCDDLERRIQKVRKAGDLAAKAVIAVDLFGLPADYERLAEITGEHGLVLLSDAAQSFGARYLDRNVGTLAPVTCTSFFPAKPLGCYGDGGALFMDDEEMAGRLRSIRSHGEGRQKYEIVRIGMNSRLDTIQAAVLLGKLPAFEGEIEKRRKLADFYDAEIGSAAKTPMRFNGSQSAWAQYTILLDNRDAVQSRLQEAGIPTAVYYPVPMHLQDAYMHCGDGAGSLPVSEMLAQRVLSLPMHGYMSDAAANRIASAVRAAIGG